MLPGLQENNHALLLLTHTLMKTSSYHKERRNGGESMAIWTMLLFAISSNVDNLTIAAAYRLHGLKIDWKANLLISIVTGCCTWLSMEAAHSAARYYLSETNAACLGAALLIAIGLWFIIDEFRRKHSHSRKNRTTRYMRYLEPYFWMRSDQEHTVNTREMFILALLLSINNLGSGIGASMMGIWPLGTAVLVSIFSLLSIFFGQKAGSLPFTAHFSQIMPWLAGLILILLGIYEIINRLLCG